MLYHISWILSWAWKTTVSPVSTATVEVRQLNSTTTPARYINWRFDLIQKQVFNGGRNLVIIYSPKQKYFNQHKTLSSNDADSRQFCFSKICKSDYSFAVWSNLFKRLHKTVTWSVFLQMNLLPNDPFIFLGTISWKRIL